MILGTVGAGEHDDLHEPETFYNSLQEVRENGYAPEAVKAVTDWAFQSFDIGYLIGTANKANIASQKVLERCGYTFINEQQLLTPIENQKFF